MISKDLLKIIDRVVCDAEMEAGFLREASSRDFILKQRFMNAGNTFQRLAAEMFVAAGSVKED